MRGLVFLGPGPPAPLGPFLTALDLRARFAALRVPILAIDPREGEGGPISDWVGPLEDQPLATALLIPGALRAALRSPWPELVATWAAFVATAA